MKFVKLDHSRLVKTMECGFYYDNKLIKTILKGATRCGGQPNKDWAKDYLEMLLHDKKMLEKKQQLMAVDDFISLTENLLKFIV